MAREKLSVEAVQKNDEIQISFLLKCIDNLFLLTLFIVHYIYSLITFLYMLLNYFYKYVQMCCVLCIPSKLSTEPIMNLSDKVKTFTKIPRHLAVIVGSEEISYRDLVNLILWCLNSEISHISFYNNKNEIDLLLLYKTICQQSKDSLLRIKWGKSFGDDIKQMARKQVNGYKWQPMLQLDVFNASSGIDCLLNVTRHFCQNTTSKIDISAVDYKIQEHMSIPDPELAIVFSKINSTFGFLPWHMRVTEIQMIPTHHNLTLDTFLSALESYANRQQRFGT